MNDPFETAPHRPEIPRDRWGRPLIIPPDGGKPVPYQRVTRFVSQLEDNYNLSLWQQRQVAIGLSGRPDLVLAAAAHKDDRDRLNDIVTQAHEAAASHAAATTGTALHSLCEQLDRGQLDRDDLSRVPAEYRPDLQAYLAATNGVQHTHIEELMVNDELKVAGTPDRIFQWKDDKYPKILDIKTGSIEYGMSKIAMQLAVYANSLLYDPETGKRTRADIDLNTAVIAHLPAGQGVCTLHEVDIATAMEGVELARQVRGWRAVKNLARPYGGVTAKWLAQIDAASTEEELTLIWRQAKNRNEWNIELTAAAARRKEHIQGGIPQ